MIMPLGYVLLYYLLMTIVFMHFLFAILIFSTHSAHWLEVDRVGRNINLFHFLVLGRKATTNTVSSAR